MPDVSNTNFTIAPNRPGRMEHILSPSVFMPSLISLVTDFIPLVSLLIKVSIVILTAATTATTVKPCFLIISLILSMKAERTVKRITFERNTTNPVETLYVSVPKLNEHEVIVPGSLSLLFDIDLSGGHANNFLVQNVSWALVEKLVVKFAATTLQDTVGYDIYKTFEDLFLSEDERNNMILDGIQSEDLCKIRSGARLDFQPFEGVRFSGPPPNNGWITGP